MFKIIPIIFLINLLITINEQIIDKKLNAYKQFNDGLYFKFHTQKKNIILKFNENDESSDNIIISTSDYDCNNNDCNQTNNIKCGYNEIPCKGYFKLFEGQINSFEVEFCNNNSFIPVKSRLNYKNLISILVNNLGTFNISPKYSINTQTFDNNKNINIITDYKYFHIILNKKISSVEKEINFEKIQVWQSNNEEFNINSYFLQKFDVYNIFSNLYYFKLFTKEFKYLSLYNTMVSSDKKLKGTLKIKNGPETIFENEFSKLYSKNHFNNYYNYIVEESQSNNDYIQFGNSFLFKNYNVIIKYKNSIHNKSFNIYRGNSSVSFKKIMILIIYAALTLIYTIYFVKFIIYLKKG